MEAVQNTGRWVPIYIADEGTGDGIAGIGYDAAGLAVSYTPLGGVETPLVLTAATWDEGQLGVYAAYFPGTAFATLGLWLYYCTYTGATAYVGSLDVVPGPVGPSGLIIWPSGSLLTWTDIAAYVGETVSKETARPSPQHVMNLGNHALAQISRIAGELYREWTNDVLGDLSILGRVCQLSTDLIRVESVFWDTVALDYRTTEWLDNQAAGWRTQEGTPGYYTIKGGSLLFDALPSGSSTGLLVVRGYGSIPNFGGIANPLAYLPLADQILPAYYILSMLPARKHVITEGGRIVGVDTSEADRKVEYTALWRDGLRHCAWALTERENRPADGS